MLDFLCYQNADSYLPKMGPASHIRILHAAPGTRKLDIMASGYLIGRSLSYRKYTPYFPIPAGEHKIKAYSSGTKVAPFSESIINFEAGSIYTVAVIGDCNSMEILLIPDIKPQSQDNAANIRAVNLSHDCHEVEVAIPDSTVDFPKVNYKDITSYSSMEQGNYTIQIRNPDENRGLLSVPGVTLKPDWNYTIYIIGLHEEKIGLQCLTLLDGSTYINNKP